MYVIIDIRFSFVLLKCIYEVREVPDSIFFPSLDFNKTFKLINTLSLTLTHNTLIYITSNNTITIIAIISEFTLFLSQYIILYI